MPIWPFIHLSVCFAFIVFDPPILAKTSDIARASLGQSLVGTRKEAPTALVFAFLFY